MTSKTIIIIIILLLTLTSCRENKNTPEYVAKQYLLALMNKDWDKAKSYATKEAGIQIDFLRDLKVDYGITEVKNIKCELFYGHDPYVEKAQCTFCCAKDSTFEGVNLGKENGKEWKIEIPKEGGVPGINQDSTHVE